MAIATAMAGGASAQGTRASSGRVYHIALPLLFDGVYQGDIAAKIGGDGQVQVETARLLTLLGPRITSDTVAQIKARSDAGGLIALSALGDLGIRAEYDSSNLQIKFSIPLNLQGTQVISTTGGINTNSERKYLPQAALSGSTTLTLRQTYNWRSQAGREGFAPVTVAGDVALNAGGAGGVSLLGQFEYDGSRTDKFNRGNVQMVHDDEKRAIRYTLGDLAPTTTGFQSSPLIGGLSIERQYGAIQPLRNIRPSGRMGFVLDRPATVDLVVNGTTIRTMQLAAGQYNLRDFPFFNGLNQVDLYVVDQMGRRLLTSFSQYYSPRLLDEGILEFGLSGGALETSGSTGSRYGQAGYAASAFVRYGVSRALTSGINGQIGRDQWNIGSETSLATPLGTFALVGSVSRHNFTGTGSAALVSYEGAFAGGKLLSNIRFNLEGQVTSRSYTPLTQNAASNTTKANFSGRISGNLPGRIGLGVSYSRYLGRDSEPDQTRYAVNLSRGFGRFNLSLSGERAERVGSATDNRGLLTLSVPLGRNQLLRSGYDSRSNTATAEVSQFQRNELGGIGLRAALNHADSGYSGSGEFSYADNRLSARINHAVITDNHGTITSQQSSYTLATQFAFAGSEVAVGRPVGARFAIVDRHATLEGSPVDVWQGASRQRAQARADRLGPALVSAGSPYLPIQLKVDATNLPMGYDLGAGQYDLRPGMAGGYHLTVGSDASRLVMGVALDARGAPLGLRGGAMVRVGDKSGTKILIFTNRNGRFVANGIAPGKYVVMLGENGEHHADITVPEKSKGSVMIGELKMEGPVSSSAAAVATPVATASPAPAAKLASAALAPVFHDVAPAQTAHDPLASQSVSELRDLAKGWRRIGHRRLQHVLARHGVAVERRQLHQLYRLVVHKLRHADTRQQGGKRRYHYSYHYHRDGQRFASIPAPAGRALR